MKEMGLEYDVVNKINPRIIYASLSGFGSTGPSALRPGFDIIVAGMYGMMSVTGEENSVMPGKPGVAMTDVCAGLFLHGAVLAALFERNKSNLGQKIETSLMEGQLATLVNTASNYLITNEDDKSPRLGTKHKSIVPYQSFICKDGKSMIIGVGSDKQFQQFCKALDIIDISIDNRFKTNQLRVENRNILIPYLEKIFSNNDRSYYENEFAKYSFPYGKLTIIFILAL
jgi:succinate--hydroxymethylglutarate CoA-transferase